jgi:hypothetical protein
MEIIYGNNEKGINEYENTNLVVNLEFNNRILDDCNASEK